MTRPTTTQDQATSLDRLHDILLPAEVNWWPVAPGWYGLLVILTAFGLLVGLRYMASYRKNAYRRGALRELQSLNDPTTIAELLRRTALAIHPRPAIAKLSGQDWVDWLESQCPEKMPDSIEGDLINGAYRNTGTSSDIKPLKLYAAQWIAQHQPTSKLGGART
jgi:hypothetical protein